MNKKLRVINSYRLTQIDKYIAERKEDLNLILSLETFNQSEVK